MQSSRCHRERLILEGRTEIVTVHEYNGRTDADHQKRFQQQKSRKKCAYLYTQCGSKIIGD